MVQLGAGNTAERFKPEEGTGWSWRLLIFTFFIFLIVSLGYLGIELGYSNFLQSQLTTLKGQVPKITATVSEDDKTLLGEFYSRMTNLSTILGTHVSTSRVFPLLEKVTNRQVVYSSLELSTKDKTLLLSGAAASFEILGRQLLAYEKAPEVDRVLLQSSQLRDNTVNFVVRLVMNPSLFLP